MMLGARAPFAGAAAIVLLSVAWLPSAVRVGTAAEDCPPAASGGPWRVRVESAVFQSGLWYSRDVLLSAPPGQVYYRVELSITNEGAEPAPFPYGGLRLVDADGRRHAPADSEHDPARQRHVIGGDLGSHFWQLDGDLYDGTDSLLNPGVAYRLPAVFLVPEDARAVALETAGGGRLGIPGEGAPSPARDGGTAQATPAGNGASPGCATPVPAAGTPSASAQVAWRVSAGAPAVVEALATGGDDQVRARSGAQFLRIDLEIANAGDAPSRFPARELRLVDTAGRRHAPHLAHTSRLWWQAGVTSLHGEPLVVPLNPGVRYHLPVVFEMPTDAAPDRVETADRRPVDGVVALPAATGEATPGAAAGATPAAGPPRWRFRVVAVGRPDALVGAEGEHVPARESAEWLVLEVDEGTTPFNFLAYRRLRLLDTQGRLYAPYERIDSRFWEEVVGLRSYGDGFRAIFEVPTGTEPAALELDDGTVLAEVPQNLGEADGR